MAEKDQKIAQSRIVYTEPNFANNITLDGVDLSVPLEDMCISVDLIAEIKNRFSEQISQTVLAQWVSGGKDLSFFEGVKLNKNDDETYLTTYFTDITYEDAKGNGVIEGLGIESIDINFDSWFTPMVTIKFVDVRGSSILVPNQYDKEVNNSKYVTSDKLYKCFFTFPYPRFRLMVKGFYGKPVTYQLTVSKFNGSFNATNGNFEAVVNFIGYNYSLLTDIQFQYIAAAPYDSYYGREYFDKNRTQSRWLLDGSVEPPTLYDFYNKIITAIPEIQKLLNTDPISIQNTIASSEIDYLENIRDAYHQMILSLDAHHYKMVSNSKQIVYGFDSDYSIEFERDFVQKYNNFIGLVNAYNDNTRHKDRVFTSDILPNGRLDKMDYNEQLKPKQAFTIKKKSNGKISVIPYSYNTNPVTYESIKTSKYNDGRQLDEEIANHLIKLCKSEGKVNLKKCVYLFNINNFEENVNNRIEECNNKRAEYRRIIDLFVKRAVKETIGFMPTVYNVSKLIFIHLETFLASMFRCSSNIFSSVNNGERTFSSYNINIDDTDVNYIDGNNKGLPPFPLLTSTKGYSTNYSGVGDSNLPVYTWIGDLNANAEEKLLIEGYTRAVQVQQENLERDRLEMQNNSIVQNLIPLLPTDLVINKSPFSYNSIPNKTLDEFVMHIGLRGIQLFGFLFKPSDKADLLKLAQQAGEIDAYNFYHSNTSKDEIKNEILTKIGKGRESVNNIIGILSCTNDNFAEYNSSTKRSSYSFELRAGVPLMSPNRNPILNKSKYSYSYMYTKGSSNDVSKFLYMIPVNIFNSKELKSRFTNLNVKPFNFPLLDVNFKNEYCVTLRDDIIEDVVESGVLKQYINDFVCNVYYNEDVNRIGKYYETINKGQVSVKDYKAESDFNEIIKKIWRFDDNVYRAFYHTETNVKKPTVGDIPYKDTLPNGEINNVMLSGSLLNKSITTDAERNKYLLPTKVTKNTEIVPSQWRYRDWYDNNGVHDYQIILNTINNKPDGIDNYSILEIPIFENNVVNSLFGHPFYYLQNIQLTDESEDDFNYRSIRAKALLFLHCLPINYSLFDLDSDLKNGYISRIPKAVILFVGGLLWRHEYVKSYTSETAIKDVFNYDFRGRYKEPKGREELNSHITEITLFSNTNGRMVDVKRWGIDCKVYFGYDIFSLRQSIKNKLIKEFETWVVGDFRNIQKEYELIHVNEGISEVMTPDKLVMLSSLWLRIYSNGNSGINSYNENAPSTYKTVLDYTQRFGVNFLKNYASFYAGFDGTSLRLLIRDDTDAEDLLRDIYSDTCVFSVGTYATNDKSAENEIVVKKEYLEKYIDSVISTLYKIANENKVTDNTNTPIDLEMQRDINIAMYMYLKNVYDKWLTGESLDMFTVDKFFDENFIFVDTFYRNISNDLMINCEYFAQLYVETNKTHTLFSFLADMYAKHGMIFTPTSNFNDWSRQDVLDEMFKPIPYNSTNPMERENKFICMYTHEPSRNANIGGDNSSYGYKYDGFDIYDENNPGNVDIQPKVFKNVETRDDGVVYAYPIPAFGVAFGKNNQSYFKSISVNMDNPVTTEYAIKAIWDIAKLGGDSTTKMQFVGQDLFTVWSNYSYTCEVEMLGCAQIQPLMYFQLLNIPLFNGTYIIKNVSHRVTPGDMITKFTGVKLSKNGQPFNSKPFGMLGVLSKNAGVATMPLLNQKFIGEDTSYEDLGGKYYKYFPPEDVVLSDDNDCECQNGSGWNGLSDTMKKLFISIKRTVESIDGNENGKEWTICMSSGHRPKSRESSDHFKGNAMDLQIKRKGIYITGGMSKNELGIVFDIIVTAYYPYIKQVIMEYIDSRSMKQNFNLFNTIHFASLGKNATKHPTIYQSDTKEGNNCSRMYTSDMNKSTNKMFSEVGNEENSELNAFKNPIQEFMMKGLPQQKTQTKYEKIKDKVKSDLSFVSPYYKDTAKKRVYSYLPNNLPRFKNIFTTFRGVSDEALKCYFDLEINTNANASSNQQNNEGNDTLFGISYLSLNKRREGYTEQKRCDDISKFTKRLKDVSQKYGFNPNWLMIAFACESGIDPSDYNNKSEAAGMMQFTPQYYRDKWGLTSDAIRQMDATAQMEYVEKYFEMCFKTWRNIKIEHPIDIYLLTIAPAIFDVSNRYANSVVYASSEASGEHPSIIPNVSSSGYEGNKNIDTDGKGYITIQDLENFYFGKALQFAKTEEENELITHILSSSSYK